MTDRGLAALEDALDATAWIVNNELRAAAILGDGVFLPGGDCGHDPGLFPFASRFAAYEAEIKRLLELLAAEHRAQFAMRHSPGACETCDILPDDALLEVPG